VSALILNVAQAARIEAEARRAFPREACGLLLGTRDEAGRAHVARVVPAPNTASGPDRFEIDPALLLALHREARGAGEAIVGHYHSHPNGSPAPSARDLAEAAWPGLVWLIAALGAEGEPRMAAFLHPEGVVAPARFEPLALVIKESLA
jgi:proteasome lid subunit RPN8/RPN11